MKYSAKKIRNFDHMHTMQSLIIGNVFLNFQIMHFGEKKYDAYWHLHAGGSETCFSDWRPLQCRTVSLCSSPENCPQQSSSAMQHCHAVSGIMGMFYLE